VFNHYGSDFFSDLDNNHYFDPSYTFSAVVGTARWSWAPTATPRPAARWQGNLLIANSATPQHHATLTSNSTGGYNIGNPSTFSGTNNDGLDPTVGSVSWATRPTTP